MSKKTEKTQDRAILTRDQFSLSDVLAKISSGDIRLIDRTYGQQITKRSQLESMAQKFDIGLTQQIIINDGCDVISGYDVFQFLSMLIDSDFADYNITVNSTDYKLHDYREALIERGTSVDVCMVPDSADQLSIDRINAASFESSSGARLAQYGALPLKLAGALELYKSKMQAEGKLDSVDLVFAGNILDDVSGTGRVHKQLEKITEAFIMDRSGRNFPGGKIRLKSYIDGCKAGADQTMPSDASLMAFIARMVTPCGTAFAIIPEDAEKPRYCWEALYCALAAHTTKNPVMGQPWLDGLFTPEFYKNRQKNPNTIKDMIDKLRAMAINGGVGPAKSETAVVTA